MKTKDAENPQPVTTDYGDRMIFQGWLSVAIWMSVGLLLEGLLGYKIPAYLNDPQRRELFRLAHTHGTFLGLVLVAAALCAERYESQIPRIARMALKTGSILMPVGFLLAGIWHPEGDPGPAIWIVPPAALMLIFGVIAIILAFFKKPTPKA
ncbi:MAG: hypothetical protein WBV94_20305 [Blastocatellia bacterium]